MTLIIVVVFIYVVYKAYEVKNKRNGSLEISKYENTPNRPNVYEANQTLRGSSNIDNSPRSSEF